MKPELQAAIDALTDYSNFYSDAPEAVSAALATITEALGELHTLAASLRNLHVELKGAQLMIFEADTPEKRSKAFKCVGGVVSWLMAAERELSAVPAPVASQGIPMSDETNRAINELMAAPVAGPIGFYADPGTGKPYDPRSELVLSGALLCLKTGNPCGTDTWEAGYECLCDCCKRWLSQRAPVAKPSEVLARSVWKQRIPPGEHVTVRSADADRIEFRWHGPGIKLDSCTVSEFRNWFVHVSDPTTETNAGSGSGPENTRGT